MKFSNQIFKLIKGFIKTFSHFDAYNLKRLHMLKSGLLVTTYYLRISIHEMKLKFTLTILFHKECCSIIS